MLFMVETLMLILVIAINSNDNIALAVFCSMDNLVSAHSIGNHVKYTYTSDIDNDNTLITLQLITLYYLLNYLVYSMCSLAVSIQDSPAIEPRSNPGSGKI